MSTRSIIDKLFAANAVQIGESNEPSFTLDFQKYVGRYAGLNRDKITVIQGWRAMLAGFDISLAMVSDEEIMTLVNLLEYQLNAAWSTAISI